MRKHGAHNMYLRKHGDRAIIISCYSINHMKYRGLLLNDVDVIPKVENKDLSHVKIMGRIIILNEHLVLLPA